METSAAQMLAEDVLPVAIQTLSAILIALISYLGMKASKWLEAKTHSASFSCATEKLVTITKGLVHEAERTLVREAKDAASDGKLTKEDAVRIRDEVAKRTKEHLGARGVKELQGCLGHAGSDGVKMIDRMIRTHIESRVAEMKS